MKKILLSLLIISSMIYAREEQDSSLDFLLNDESILDEGNRATPSTAKPKTIPVVDFSRPLVFNPNNTPYPTQPAQITDIRNLIVYVAGANENGPFGSSQNAINQINAINNNNIGFVNVMNLINLQNLIANQINNNQNNGNSTINPNTVVQNSLTQGAANQSASTQGAAQQSGVHANATSQLSINQNSNQVQNSNSNQAATTTNATTNTTTNPNQIPNFFANLTPNQITNQIALQLTNQNQSTTNLTAQQLATQLANQTNALSAAGIASSGLNGSNFGGIKNTNLLNQISAIQAAMSSSTQTNNSNQSSAASTTAITPLTQQLTVTNPNPFITLNDPVLTPKSVIWNSPLIIDNNNHFFDTQSTLVLQENIVFNPGANYTFPTDFVNYPAAIIINKSNITIDLNGFNLSLDAKSASNFLVNQPIHGISIMPGVQNVKIISSTQNIQTGSISNFSGYAVYANGFSTQFSAALATSVYNIHQYLIQNILIENLLMYGNLGGISMTNVLQAFINFVAVSYSTGNQDVFGINCNKVLNLAITNCKINQNYSNSNVIGISLVNTISTTVTNVLVDNNRSLYNNSTGILISSTTGLLSRDNKIDNCNITGNICGFVAGNQSIGIHLTGGSFSNLIQSCNIASNAFGSALIPPLTNPFTYGIKIETSLENIIGNNDVAFHTTCGIIDTATLSTSLFTRNICTFNTLNYSAQVIDGVTIGGIPLPTTIVYPGNMTAYTGGGPVWQNIDVRLS